MLVEMMMMVDASSDGFWTFDVPTGKVYWSNRVAKLLGIDPDQVDDTFETLKRCVIESDWEVFRKEMTKSTDIMPEKLKGFPLYRRCFIVKGVMKLAKTLCICSISSKRPLLPSLNMRIP